MSSDVMLSAFVWPCTECAMAEFGQFGCSGVFTKTDENYLHSCFYSTLIIIVCFVFLLFILRGKVGLVLFIKKNKIERNGENC